jgi:serine/threonine protein kinase
MHQASTPDQYNSAFMRETIGQYKVLDRLGAGGIGDVYRARDTRFGRTVAIHFVSSDIANTPDQRERFVADARAAMVLSHPNIALLYEVGEDQGQLFLATEYVPGDPLTRLTAGHALHVRRAIDYATQIADAIADAHAQGIVHGDLCASNIIITPKGSAKLLEFGLSSWTSGGKARGKRDDIVSLGHLIVEMTTGEPVGGTGLSPATAKGRPEVPELDPIVTSMLTHDGGKGYPSAAIIAAELRAVGAAIGERRAPVATVTPAPPRAQSQSPSALAIALIVLVAVAFLGWFLTLR